MYNLEHPAEEGLPYKNLIGVEYLFSYIFLTVGCVALGTGLARKKEE